MTEQTNATGPRRRRFLAITGLAVLAATLTLGGVPATQAAPVIQAHYVDTWTAAPTYLGAPYSDRTVRNIVHTSVSGLGLRVRLSNAFGSGPVTFDDVDVGVQSSGAALVPGTNRRVTFGGQTSVTVPLGAEALSDPLPGFVAGGTNLAVSMHVVGSSGEVTGHPDAQQVNYYTDEGDFAASDSAADYPYTIGNWFFVDGIEVSVPKQTRDVIALGDSITDGYNSTVGANARWPDDLARRLLALPPSRQLGVANQGISANQVTADGSGRDGGQAGVSAEARFDRDVLAQPGATTVILLEGINDIGDGTVTSASQLIAADQLIIAQAHAAGLRILGATLTPFEGAGYYSPAREQIREQLNQWIRAGGAFDGVLDFDRVVRDPADPLMLAPAYDSGDHLHPSDAGYQAMADAIDLGLLQ
ncbi:MAG: family lipolytic protein [Actinomycetia bacterium]|nr:family lipolytic protein [Actinomycetes bacterium]